jgi:hypothetical protein
MRAWCDRGISRVVPGSGLTGGATSSLRTGAGDEIGRTRGFRAGRSAEGAGSESDGATGCRFGVKSASATWRALVIRSRSSPRGWCRCSRWLSKGRPDCLATRDIEVECVNFGKSLPQMLLNAPIKSMSNAVLFVEHRVGEAKFADRGGDLRDLLVAVRARVYGTGRS